MPIQGPIIGIDLGTTHSLCAVFRDGKPTLIPNAHGEFLTPSVVAKTEDDLVLVGSAAKELRSTRPDLCAWNFKRMMGTDQLINWASGETGAIALSSLVLGSLKCDAEVYLEEPVRRAVITVPAYFNEHQRQATRLAARLAGLDVERILNEPTAAALAHGFHRRRKDGYLLVLDIGGGTCDLALMEVFEGVLEIMATAGLSHLGGDDFTSRIVASELQKVGESLEVAEFRQPLRFARLWREMERAKCALESNDSADYQVPDDKGVIDTEQDSLQLSLKEFDELTHGLLERIDKPLERLLRDARLHADQLDEVLLVGGATRMQNVKRHIEAKLSCQTLSEVEPEQAVVLGASVQAGLIDRDEEVSDLVMTDVCPHTLGVEIVKEFGKQTLDGYFLPVLHRNTTIPVSREEFVATIHTDQQELLLRIYQGESRRTRDNLLIGELHVSDLPPSPAGLEVAVRLTYDINGLLEVEARVGESEVVASTLITHHCVGLDEDAIERAAQQLEEIKFYPRDDLENLRLVHFAESVVVEQAPRERFELEELIDAYERAMSRTSRQVFEAARRMLIIYLTSLGHPPKTGDSTGTSMFDSDWSDAA
ncbi:MAG: molecular chaperone HscC [Planctomycetota bacterium]|jgi:molecular chaperone HscC